MSETLIRAALDRIDRAVARIEAAERGLAAPKPDLSGEYRILEQRHDRLRGRIQDTIDTLDAMIAQEGVAQAEIAREGASA